MFTNPTVWNHVYWVQFKWPLLICNVVLCILLLILVGCVPRESCISYLDYKALATKKLLGAPVAKLLLQALILLSLKIGLSPLRSNCFIQLSEYKVRTPFIVSRAVHLADLHFSHLAGTFIHSDLKWGSRLGFSVFLKDTWTDFRGRSLVSKAVRCFQVFVLLYLGKPVINYNAKIFLFVNTR